jgi:hypothetical protein
VPKQNGTMKIEKDEDERLTECTAPSSSALPCQFPSLYPNLDGKPHQAGSSRVADYFAVLGAGSTLTRKQKVLGITGVKSSTSSSSTLTTQHNEAEQQLEEECTRLQRWYREITNVILLGNDSLLEELLVGRKEEQQQSPCPITSALLRAEHDGYEVIRYTRSNGAIYYNYNAFSHDDSILNTSTQLLDTTNSGNISYSMYSNVSNSASSTINPEEMIWEANIHSRYGIRRDVLLYRTGYTNNNNHNSRMMLGGTKSINKDMDGHTKGMKRLGDVAAALLAGKSQQYLSPKQQLDPVTSREGVVSSISSSSFFVAYRRRLPDEDDLRAIADIRIMYLQLPMACFSHDQFAQSTNVCVARETPGKASSRSSSISGVPDKRTLSGILSWRRSNTGNSRPESPWNTVTNENETVRFQEEEDRCQRNDIRGKNESIADISRASLVPLLQIIGVPKGYDEVILPPCLKEFKIQYSRYGNQHAIPKIIEIPPIEGIMMESSNPYEAPLLSSRHEQFLYVPVLVIRRVRIGEEERWHEDPGITEISMSYLNIDGNVSVDLARITEIDDEEDECLDSNDR